MRKKFVFIITHGNFGIELLKSVEMIMGEQKDATALGLRLGDSVDNLRSKAEDIITENQMANKDIIILVDILGGSPSNIALYMLRKYINVNLITGVNMPMLIEIFQSREVKETDELLEKAIDSSIDGIKRYNLN